MSTQRTSKYRVWFAVPVEVSALDSINAETEARTALGEIGYELPMLGSDRDRLNKMVRVLSNDTEIRTGRKWSKV